MSRWCISCYSIIIIIIIIFQKSTYIQIQEFYPYLLIQTHMLFFLLPRNIKGELQICEQKAVTPGTSTNHMDYSLWFYGAFFDPTLTLHNSSLQNENAVIIYSPSYCFKLSLFCWTQRKIFWRMSVTRQLTDTVCFHSRKKIKILWKLPFFKISSFVLIKSKKLIQVWNKLRVSKWWLDFHFWANYPFNGLKTILDFGLQYGGLCYVTDLRYMSRGKQRGIWVELDLQVFSLSSGIPRDASVAVMVIRGPDLR